LKKSVVYITDMTASASLEPCGGAHSGRRRRRRRLLQYNV